MADCNDEFWHQIRRDLLREVVPLAAVTSAVVASAIAISVAMLSYLINLH